MKTLVTKPEAIAVALPATADRHSAVDGDLILRPTDDGCALTTRQGKLVFRSQGRSARRRCLQVAYQRGALVVLS